MPGPQLRLVVVSLANTAIWCLFAGVLFRLEGSEAVKTEALREYWVVYDPLSRLT